MTYPSPPWAVWAIPPPMAVPVVLATAVTRPPFMVTSPSPFPPAPIAVQFSHMDADPAKIDEWSSVYHKPRVSHEICIDGTYTDLSLKDRYKGTRIERTEMFSSIEHHLEAQGILKNAPLYFKNSSEWQRRVRKYCFEAIRRCENMAGYDFLGPIDTH